MQNTLGEFIRTHRERLKPEDIGLPTGTRRRTPGLRREELAKLCEVSPTWLTWLEQGRPISVSTKMLVRLAEVMHLTAAQRAYLFRLADKLDPSDVQADNVPGEEGLDSVVRAIRLPAYILNRQWYVPAWNRPAAELFEDWLGATDNRSAASPPNLLRFMFCEEKARTLIVDWDHRAARLVAEFRAECGKYADQEPVASLINELKLASAQFRQLWISQNVVDREGGVRRFLHSKKGELTFEQMNFQLAKQPHLKLIMLMPVK